MAGKSPEKAKKPYHVVDVPGPRFLGILLSLIGLFGGLIYIIGIGTEQGVLALIGVCVGALFLLVIGFFVRQNMTIIEADEHNMILRPYPLKIYRTGRIPRSEIGGFMVEQTGTTKSGTPLFALVMFRGSKGPQRLAFYDTNEEAAKQDENILTEFFT